MKRILSVLAVMAVASAAFAQGTFNLQAPANSIQFKSTSDGTPVNVAANNGWVSALWAPAGSAYTAWSATSPEPQNLTQWLDANPAWKQVTVDGTASGAAFAKAITSGGRLLNTGITIPQTGPVDLILIGWTGAAGTFDAAYELASEGSGITVGMSSRLQGLTPAVAPAPPTVAAFSGGMVLTPTAIPEPSTFALAGLGAAALMIFRRRK